MLFRQMKDFISNVRSAAFGTIFSALVILPTMATYENAAFWIGWFIFQLLLDGLRVKHTIDFHKLDENRINLRGHAIYAAVLALGCGVNWSVAFAVMWSTAATPAEFLLLTVLAAGIMSTALLQYRHFTPSALILMGSCMVAGTGIAFIYPLKYALPIIVLTWLHGAIIMLGVLDHARFYKARLVEELELEKSEQTVRLLLHEYEESASDWLWETDSAGRLIEISDRFAEAAGRSAEDLAGKPLVSLFEEAPERDELEVLLARKRPFRQLAARVACREGEIWWSVSAKPVGDGAMRGVMSDVSAQIVAEKRLSRMARSDALTDLANRLGFNERLATLHARKCGEYALMLIDLDRFKVVNDTLGHNVGDELLRSAARRIVQEVEPDDLVARLGGDEFAIIVHNADTASGLASRLVSRLSDPFRISGRVIRTSASIGTSRIDPDELEPEDAMRRADLALYASKDAGRNCHRNFSAKLHEMERRRRKLELDLRDALTEGQFSLVFQPQLDFSAGETSGMEALVRWNHPELGMIMPDEFIGIAEEAGLIAEIGDWISRDAIRQAASWRSPIKVALNLSPLQMRSESFVVALVQTIASSGIQADRIEVEITETALLHDTAENVQTLHRLRDLGVRIALDDFGTGYSSLNYLRKFPFDTIKIDRCFVQDLMNRPDCQAIIRAVVSLADELSMTTVAEGIETQEQFDWLKKAGCTAGQGFFISPPQSLETRDSGAMDDVILLGQFPPMRSIEEEYNGDNQGTAGKGKRQVANGVR